jgi:hypothetical protein
MEDNAHVTAGMIYIKKIWCSYERVYFPQMCSMNTEAMKSSDITRTGTGPLQQQQHYYNADL